MLKRFWNDEQGQDILEYALLLAFIAMAAAGILVSVGADVKAIFSVTSKHMGNAKTAATTP